MAVDLALIEQLREYDTPTIAESLSLLGCKDNHKCTMGIDVKIMTHFLHPIVGVAVTLVVNTSTPGLETELEGIMQAGEKIRASKVPTIVVMKSVGSRMTHECVTGDYMCAMFQAGGCVGLVADGGIRDLEAINHLGFTVYGSGTMSDHASVNYKLANEPITVSDVTVDHGDLLHADINGVHLIPAEYHNEIVEACRVTSEFETGGRIIARRTDLGAREKWTMVKALVEEHKKNAGR